MARGVSRLLHLVRAGGDDDPGRAPILDAALDAFLDFGIKRTSMGEVARRSRLSPATLYRRFAQKPELVRAVGLREVRRFVAHVDQRVQETIDQDASAEEQITELYLAFLDGLRRNRLIVRLLSTEPEIVLPYLTTEGAPVIELGKDYLADFVRRLQAEGKLPDYDPEPVAETIARVGLSIVLTPQTCLPLDDEQAARRFVKEHVVVAFRVPGTAEPAAERDTA